MDVLLHDGFPGSERRAGANSMAPSAIARKLVSSSPLCPPRRSFGTIFSTLKQKAVSTALTPGPLWLVSCPKLSRKAGSSPKQ
jgi:hypothetical protein